MEKTIQTIDGSEQSRRRKYIYDMVSMFKIMYPGLYSGAIEHSKKVRKSKIDVFGTDGSKSKLEASRHLLTIPTKLFNAIDQNLGEPQFLKDDDEYIWFRKMFPEFSASEKD